MILSILIAILGLATTPAIGLNFGAIIDVGLIITIIGFAITIRKWINEEDDRRKKNSKELTELIIRGCREYTSSREYKMDKDARIREIVNEEIESAFKERAPSFVDSKVYAVEMKHLNSTVGEMTQTVNKIYGLLLAREVGEDSAIGRKRNV